MKIYIRYTIALFSILFFVSILESCTNLDEKIYSDVAEDLYNYEPGDATKEIGAAYANLRKWTDAGGGSGINIAQAISSDEAVFPANGSGWDDGGKFKRMHQHKWTSTQDHVKIMWEAFYTGVVLCNNVLSIISKDDFPYAEYENKQELIAETRALRAFYYWYIMDNFGDAPLVTEPWGDMPGKTPRKEIFNFVVQELKEVIEILPVTKSKATYGRFNRWAAKALLANVYLNAEVYTGQEEWEACIKQCNDIFNSGLYQLDENYTDLFKTDNENSLESIFAIPFDDIYAKGFNYHLAALHGANQKTYQLEASPWGAGAYKGTPQFIDTYDEDDIRLPATWMGGPQFESDGVTPLLGAYDKNKKHLIFVNIMPDGNETSEAEGLRWLKYEIAMGSKADLNNDYVLFRLAQVYLMKAECLLRTNKADEAAVLVTEVRKRAFRNNPEKATVTGAQLQGPSSYKYGTVKDYILTPQTTQYPEKYGRMYDELGWELCGETCRRRDMIRFGHYTKAAWLSHEPSEDYRTVYPIPEDIVNTNPNLDQNPDYVAK